MFPIWVLIKFSFFISVNSQRTGAKLRSAEERIPLEIFMKDEPMRQDSNEKSLRAMHLCMEEDRKELLITCDARYSSDFACVGAWEGNIQKCDKFKEKEVAAAICVQDESSYVSICEYKNLKSSYLCSPRKLTWINHYKNYSNSEKISPGLREDIRPCNNKQRRICLENGVLLPCVDIGQTKSEMDGNEKKFLKNIGMQDKPVSQYDIQNVSNNKYNFSNKAINNHIIRHRPINNLSPQIRVLKHLNPKEELLAFELDTNENEPRLTGSEPRSQSDSIRDSSSMKAQWESQKPKWRRRTIPKKRSFVPKHSLKAAETASAKPSYTYKALFRAPSRRSSVEATTDQENESKSFFYVLRCKDCDIQNVMLVDENAEDVIPEVETWTFKT